ncbi:MULTISPECIES: ISAs1 family transposase [unclassified Moorena]|uniref:ISAs1 family transposase n=3 Tax=Moorena TaxID=1155738 RepID=UPI0025F5757C|nr:MULTISPECIES: ISAs1 family transposase [unclassified Moorena]
MKNGFMPALKPPKKDYTRKNTNFLKPLFLNHFGTLTDPRIDRSKKHLLIDIIAIAILAVISGADGWVGIETYGQAKYEWLSEFLDLPNGIPSHDTFSRVFARLNPEEFQQGFLNWVNSITKKLGVKVIAIDGKTLKQSYDRNQKQKALHIVSAWSDSHQLVLGQHKVKEKSNEITAIPQLLEMLSIEGSIITIDAMGCQKDITSLIINKKADYILALKANQKTLYEEVKTWFDLAMKSDFVGKDYSYYQEIESGHNRIEKREVWTVNVSSLTCLHNQSLWTGLTTIVMVRSERRLWNKTTTEVRFYISSLENNADKIAKAIRSHWGIENSLHWILDVTFYEDSSRIRKDNSPENLALLRRLALNLMKQETSFKGSLKMKRYRAAMDNNYLVKILASASK